MVFYEHYVYIFLKYTYIKCYLSFHNNKKFGYFFIAVIDLLMVVY
ncbi:hypothetical protein B4168_0541 [Anoxybacillus flavithermus]|nr:hypothetical protein B4168_0541 [Anoxybacillus flavithermus]OAO86550.1 hypothetical protein GT23_1568 [Parageobacillus thermoglucosidasius]